MKLRNSLRHMLNQKVNVCGNSYDINGKGEIEIEDEKAVAALLQNDVWSKKVGVRTPVREAKTPNYKAMSKADLINMLKYKQIAHKGSDSKAELIKLLEPNEE